MMQISMNDFRGFSRQKPVSIKPLTILVGENSAGKSSFLAALKYMSDLMTGRQTASFNSDPFQLGTFQQIAHFRGGRGGRAKTFEIGITADLQLETQITQDAKIYPTILRATFVNLDSQATLSSLRITHNRESIVIGRSADDKTSIAYFSKRGERIMLDNDSPAFSAQIELPLFWQYLMANLSFRLQTELDVEINERLTKARLAAAIKLTNLAEAMRSMFHGATQATSAIRMKPQRTYTPGTETRDGEGSHVPFEIA